MSGITSIVKVTQTWSFVMDCEVSQTVNTHNHGLALAPTVLPCLVRLDPRQLVISSSQMNWAGEGGLGNGFDN